MTHITLAELLHRLDTPINTNWWGEALVEDMGEYSLRTGLSQHGFTTQPIFEWMCTDTTVGYHIVRLHGEPVALMTQEGRKMGVEFSWMSEPAYWRVRNFIHQLARAEEDKPAIDVVKLDALVPTEYSVEFSSQLIHNWVLYEGGRHEVVKRFHGYDPSTWHKVVIRGPDGVERKVDVRDVRVATPLKPPIKEQ